MLINLLKGLLGTTVLTVAPVETALNLIDTTKEKQETPEDSLYTMIKKSSTVSSTKTKWDYDGKQFYSENNLNDYVVKNNKIETIQTSTNPGKIINDYQYHTLDPEKIYDTNFDNYQLVYRDAFGNVSLSKEKALETYTNKGLVKPQYSYDSIKWYDSPEEAKSGYIYKAGLQKSLYYFLNGRYYNVFNKKDQEELKSILTEGYTLKPSLFTKNETIHGTRESLKNIVHDNFKPIWGSAGGSETSLHYTNFLKSETKHTITLKPGSEDVIQVWKNNDSKIEYKSGETLEISDINNQFNFERFKNSIYWSKKREWYTAGVHKFIHSQTFNNGKDKYTIHYLPAQGVTYMNDTEFDFKKLTSSESYDTTLFLYDNDYRSSNKKELLHWDKLLFNITGPSEIPTQYVNEAYDIWFNDFYDNKFLRLDKGSDPWDKYNDYGVYQDILYDINGKQGHKYFSKSKWNCRIKKKSKMIYYINQLQKTIKKKLLMN